MSKIGKNIKGSVKGAARNITIESLSCSSIEEQEVEICERKGIGHPDTICDSVMNGVSVALCKEYLKRFGAIMHHNIDKGLLVAGSAEHKFGGGRITEPMLLIFGDRATFNIGSETVPVDEIAISSAKKWFKSNLRFVDPDEHLNYQVELKEGSAELTDIFRRREKGKPLGANDTSACVGYAPMSRVERLVLSLEQYLNSKSLKKRFPELGEDIKIMAVRNHEMVKLTVAAPLIERFVKDELDYFRKKDELYEEIISFTKEYDETEGLTTHVDVNTLDKRGRGINGCYLSVLGTSAEDADCGQVGRGNRVNGVIPLNRPVSAEAAAGKNPVSHIGKIYNVLSHRIARSIYSKFGKEEGVKEVYVWLVSQIGKPIDQPKIAAAQLILNPKTSLLEISDEINDIVDHELESIGKVCDDLAKGKIKVC
jgi:S-adenosylmethionine synthetase